MNIPVVNVEARTEKGTGKLRAMRNQGKVPGVIYGHNKKFEPELISMDELKLRLQLDTGRKLFQVSGSKNGDLKAIVAEVQVDELTDKLLHVDLQRVEQGDRVSLKIPLSVKGVPAGARQGGRLEVFLHELRIECASENLIEEFVLDVAPLNIGDRVTLGSLDLPESVSARGLTTTTVCIVHPPKGSRGSEGVGSEPPKQEEKAEETKAPAEPETKT